MSKLFTRMVIAVFIVLGEWAVANYLLGWQKTIAWWLGLYVLVVPLTYVLDLLDKAANKAYIGLAGTLTKIRMGSKTVNR